VAINNAKSIIESLIYDRTQSDVDYALSLEQDSIYTDEDLKGAYNCSDRNRVGGAINYLTDGMELLGFRVKDNWIETDIAKITDNINTLSCLDRLRQILTPEITIPENLDGFIYQKANAVEQLLYEMYSAYIWITDNTLFCGDGYAGY